MVAWHEGGCALVCVARLFGGQLIGWQRRIGEGA